MSRQRTIIAGVLIGVLVAGGAGFWLLMPRGDPDQTPAADLPWHPDPEDWPGVAWTATELPAPAGGWATPSGAGLLGSSMAAWGVVVERPQPGGPGADQRGALWTSVDGVAWDSRMIAVAGRESFAPSTVVLGPFGYLAAGYADKGDWPALAGSSDGGVWTDVPRPGERVGVDTLLGTRDRYWAMGYNDGDARRVWSTTDGQEWIEVAVPGAGPKLQLASLTDTPDGVVLAGWRSGEVVEPALWRWTEPDGWTELPVPGPDPSLPGQGMAIHRITAFGGGLFATGSAGALQECKGWANRTASAAMDVAESSGDVCGWMPPATWVMTDANAWRSVTMPGLAQPNAGSAPWVRAGGRGLIALVEERNDRGVLTLALSTSADGVSWAPIGDRLTLTSDSYVYEFVALQDRVIVMGSQEARGPLAWIGARTD